MAVALGLPRRRDRARRRRRRGAGRLERVANDRGVLCVVDYAHTPDALERALAALRAADARGG